MKDKEHIKEMLESDDYETWRLGILLAGGAYEANCILGYDAFSYIDENNKEDTWIFKWKNDWF